MFCLCAEVHYKNNRQTVKTESAIRKTRFKKVFWRFIRTECRSFCKTIVSRTRICTDAKNILHDICKHVYIYRFAAHCTQIYSYIWQLKQKLPWFGVCFNGRYNSFSQTHWNGVVVLFSGVFRHSVWHCFILNASLERRKNLFQNCNATTTAAAQKKQRSAIKNEIQ